MFFRVFAIIAIFQIAGCASKPQPDKHNSTYAVSYSISVVGYNDGTNTKKSKVFITHKNHSYSKSLEFRKFKKYAANLLKRNGYLEVNSETAADLVVFLQFSVDDGKNNVDTQEIPVYGNTSQNVQFRNAWGQNTGTATVQNNNYGPTHYNQITTNYTTYKRSVSLNAFTTKNKSQKWELRITSVGRSNDLSVVYPQMLLASEQYVGKDTGSMISVDWPEDINAAQLLSGISPVAETPSSADRQPAAEKKTIRKDCNKLEMLVRAQGCY